MKKERYISLENIFWRILFAWKFIILCAVVFTISLPCIKYAYDIVNYNKNNEIISETEFTEDELEQIVKYEELETNIENLKKYQEISLYTNSNPLDVLEERFEFELSDENIDDCLEVLSDEKFVQDFVERIDLEEKEKKYYVEVLQELLTVSYQRIENDKWNVMIEIVYEKEGNIGASTAEYMDFVKAIEECMMKIDSVTLVGKTIQRIDITEISNRRSALNEILSEYYTKQTKLKEQMNDTQNQYLTKKLESDLEYETYVTETISVPRFSIKVAIIGCLVGIIFACAVVFIRVLFANKLQDVDEISDFYDIRTLGVLPLANVKNSKNRIDEFVRKMKHKKLQTTTNEVTVSNIIVACGNANINKVFVASSGDVSEIVEMTEVKTIVTLLQERGIEVIFGKSILHDADSYVQMKETGAVIFIEGVDKSNYSDMENQFMKASDSQVEILGCIVFV